MHIREPDNFFTHAIACLLTLPAMYYMCTQVNGGTAFIAATVYGLSMICLFSASALYHSIPTTEKQLFFWKRIDHSCIFLMIAGAYTPTILLVFEGTTQTALLTYMWGMTFIGVIIKVSGKLTQGWVSLTLYLALGWTIVVLLNELIEKLPIPALLWLFGGGVFYSIGSYFYRLDKRVQIQPFSYHAVWHLFVIAGAAAHFVFNCKYILKLF